jgi:FtsP/CotA-like multicopper oxidase with cupredoxin domain
MLVRILSVVLVLALTAGANGPSPQSGKTRVYYIAADEVAWDYLPLKRDAITGHPLPPPRPDAPYSTFVKAVYRQYTDAKFRTLVPRPPDQRYLGFLGPIIRAEVGDTIRIVFRNNASHPFSMHPHGVLYDKASEGALYADGTRRGDKSDDAVPPGKTYTYVWHVPERAGPGPMDGSSVIWMYHSHSDEFKDIASGLVGPLIITARGKSRPNGAPADVDREFVVMMEIGNENNSWYLHDSVKRFARHPERARYDDRDFKEWNNLLSMNGYLLGNMPMPTMRVGEHVRWYVMADVTDDADYHVMHWHGQTVLSQGMRMDMLEVLPAEMKTADMVPDNPGIWLFHCHVPGHFAAGMANRFLVLPARTSR